MPSPFFRDRAPKMVVAILLTFASGLVDIVGYLGIFHFFTAHLTGTTVQLGRGLAAGQWTDVAVAVTIVAAFLLGSFIGRALIEIGARKRIRNIASATLMLEAVLLAFVALHHQDSLSHMQDSAFWPSPWAFRRPRLPVSVHSPCTLLS